MAKYTDVIRDAIIANFEAGDQPTAAQFTNWITRIQEGIEEHDHSGTGDGDGIAALGITGITSAGVDVPDDWYLGIGAALERIVFNEEGSVSVMGADMGFGILVPLRPGHFSGARNVALLFQHLSDAAGVRTGFQFKTATAVADERAKGAVIFENSALSHGRGHLHLCVDIVGDVGNAGPADAKLTITDTGLTGINTVAPGGQLHVKVIDAAAIPNLVLAQLDVSEGTINFVASDRGVITGATNSLESVRVEVNGVVRRIAVYADA